MKGVILGKLLKLIRGDMTQQELADLLFVDRSTIAKAEKGLFTLNPDFVNRWIEVTHPNWQQMQEIKVNFMEAKALFDRVHATN